MAYQNSANSHISKLNISIPHAFSVKNGRPLHKGHKQILSPSSGNDPHLFYNIIN